MPFALRNVLIYEGFVISFSVVRVKLVPEYINSMSLIKTFSFLKISSTAFLVM